MKYLKICISGSFKYYETMVAMAEALSAENYIVLLPFKDPFFPSINSEEDKKARMDQLTLIHYAKIDICDILYVINVDGYIGESTKMEISYAKKIGKPVVFAFPNKQQVDDDIDTARQMEEEIEWEGCPYGLPCPHLHDIAEKTHKTKRQIVTLCGSGKFRDEFIRQTRYLSLIGNIVLTPTIFEFSGPDYQIGLSDAEHEVLDQIHRRKMDISDYILVINPGGYIGEDTREEIEYAKSKGMKISYMVDPETGKENQL